MFVPSHITGHSNPRILTHQELGIGKEGCWSWALCCQGLGVWRGEDLGPQHVNAGDTIQPTTVTHWAGRQEGGLKT